MINDIAAQENAAREIYERDIRPIVNTPSNRGKIIALDLQTRQYVIADDVLTAATRLREQYPNAVPFGFRIGYHSVAAIGTTLKPE